MANFLLDHSCTWFFLPFSVFLHPHSISLIGASTSLRRITDTCQLKAVCARFQGKEAGKTRDSTFTSRTRALRRNSERTATNDVDAEAQVKKWAIKAHSERVDRRKAVARQLPVAQVNSIEEEFDLSAPAASSSKDLPTQFSSPPLTPGLLQTLQETLGKEARPTAI
ncbi:hypothetical protein EDD22DRAFT_1029183 [Suillus occidentalis]|nr:hypothetical protein EDD22DRAFT_1029183 [Suillus occidentalis]